MKKNHSIPVAEREVQAAIRVASQRALAHDSSATIQTATGPPVIAEGYHDSDRSS